MGVAKHEARIEPALCVCVALVLCIFSVALASCVLRRGNHRLTNVPATAKCLVSGLLLGLSLFVMTPSALKQLPRDETAAQHVMLVYVSSALVMYVVHHVLMDHQHTHSNSSGPHDHSKMDGVDLESCACETPKKALGIFQKPRYCPPAKTPLPVPAPSKSPSSQSLTCADVVSVLLRAMPYTIHAVIDGATLGTAHSTMVLMSLAVPIALCAVQDVGTIIVNLTATGASRHVIFVTVASFAAGFPLGTALTAALIAGSGLSGDSAPSAAGTGEGVALLKACAGGVFAYMALFELAPPHAHGRLANLRYAVAFAGGLALVLLSEAGEDWAVDKIFASERAATDFVRVSTASTPSGRVPRDHGLTPPGTYGDHHVR